MRASRRTIALALACAIAGFALLPACIFAPLGPSRLRKTPPPSSPPTQLAPVQTGEIRLEPAAPVPQRPTP